jgi:hypothetical protein
MSDIDPSGNLNAQGIFNHSEGVKLKYAMQVRFKSIQLVRFCVGTWEQCKKYDVDFMVK